MAIRSPFESFRPVVQLELPLIESSGLSELFERLTIGMVSRPARSQHPTPERHPPGAAAPCPARRRSPRDAAGRAARRAPPAGAGAARHRRPETRSGKRLAEGHRGNQSRTRRRTFATRSRTNARQPQLRGKRERSIVIAGEVDDAADRRAFQRSVDIGKALPAVVAALISSS